ncbi:YslB family protein [Bacillus sp. FJAT-27251]|uniref:YslB family protein n=1 Tax=Bacillus sp. FJAT-27251 TaxID=1684142 RepID=UPI0006A7DB22|nr:YslB family protein [Bacillus sp. FJAT-27251]
MSELSATENQHESQQPSVSLFGHELIRGVLLQELLGKDAPEILYWAGKKLARLYPLDNFDDVVHFFQEADWGRLAVKEEKRREIHLELTGHLVTARLKEGKNLTFQLEAGFLAQQMERLKSTPAEAFEHPHKRSGKIEFTVKWDH